MIDAVDVMAKHQFDQAFYDKRRQQEVESTMKIRTKKLNPNLHR